MSLRARVDQVWEYVKPPETAPRQDRDATVIALYITGAVILGFGLTVSTFGWVQLLLLCGGGANLALARSMQQSTSLGLHYFDHSTPGPSRIALVLVGLGQLARWELVNSMLFPKKTSIPFAVIEGLLFVAYFIYIGAYFKKIRGDVVMRFCWVSAVLLAVVMYTKHWGRSMRWMHLREDHRMWHGCFSQLWFAVMLYPMPLYLPAWAIEALHLVGWFHLWTCTGHKHLSVSFLH